MITVFTPTYNRGYILHQLYDSLVNQTAKNFEWLIVDDGSTDNTREIISKWIEENKITIRYYKQENGGKHRAINKGVQHAKGDLFFIVDSDDFLKEDALDIYAEYFKQIKDNEEYAGISGRRIFKNGDFIGGKSQFDVLNVSTLNIRFKYHVKGDLAEAYKTEILKKYPFPDIEGEKFCPEALVWNQIAQKYKLRFFKQGYYVCEYLNDGLTSKIIRLRAENNGYSRLYYSQLYKLDIPLTQKIKAGINFWRFALNSGLAISVLSKSNISKFFLPIGYFFYRKDKKKLNKR